MLQKRGFFRKENGTKKIFDGFSCSYLEINTPQKFENKTSYLQKFLGLGMKNFLDHKVVTFGIWGLKTSLGQFWPKGLIKQ